VACKSAACAGPPAWGHLRGAVIANGKAFSLPRHFRESGNPVWFLFYSLIRRARASARLASRARARGASMAQWPSAIIFYSLKRQARASARLASRARARGASMAQWPSAIIFYSLKRRARACARLASRARARGASMAQWPSAINIIPSDAGRAACAGRLLRTSIPLPPSSLPRWRESRANKTNDCSYGSGLLRFPLRPYGASARQVARNDAVCVGHLLRTAEPWQKTPPLAGGVWGGVDEASTKPSDSENPSPRKTKRFLRNRRFFYPLPQGERS